VRNLFDSWWVIGPFVCAVIANLILFNRNNIGEWYGLCLGGVVAVSIIAGLLHSPLLGIIGVALLVALVILGVLVQLHGKRRLSTD
jgi:hypothetical protein